MAVQISILVPIMNSVSAICYACTRVPATNLSGYCCQKAALIWARGFCMQKAATLRQKLSEAISLQHFICYILFGI